MTGQLARYAAAALVAVACGHSGPRVEFVTLPSGYPGIAIECARVADCWRMAGESCQGGYVVVGGDETVTSTGVGVASQGSAVARSERGKRTSMLVQCERGEP